MSVPPDNLERDDDGDFQPNPRWFEGTEWKLMLRENGDHQLTLYGHERAGIDTTDGVVDVDLTGEQAANLAAYALGGHFKDYGEDADA